MKKSPLEFFPSSSGTRADKRSSLDKVGNKRNFSHVTFSNSSKLVFLCLFLALCSCADVQNGNGPNSTVDKNTLNFDVSAPFYTLKPHENIYGGSSFVFPLLYSYLAIPDANGELQKELAESWFYDREKLVWTIRLKKTARFHDGTPLTSAAVIYSLIKGNYNLSLRSIWDNIDFVRAVSATSIEIGLKRDDPDLLVKIWDGEIIQQTPQQKHIDYYSNPVGSGAYKFANRDGNKRICLISNPDYYNTPPSIGQVCFHYEPDQEKTWARLLTGQTDAATNISPENIEIMTAYGDRFHINHYTLNHISFVLYNMKIDPFSNPKVRKALTLLIDRNYIVRDILRGYGQVATGPIGVNSPYYIPDEAPAIEYNPEKALSLLEEAGLRLDETGWIASENGTPFEFTLFLSDENALYGEVAEYIQLALNDVGIKVNLKILPLLDFHRKYFHKTDFEAVLTEATGVGRNPGSIKSGWGAEKNGCSHMGCFQNNRIEDLIDRFLDEENPDEKKALCMEIERAFEEIHPASFLFQKSSLDVISKRIDCILPFKLDFAGVNRLKSASIVDE